jgi:hypothetical protein
MKSPSQKIDEYIAKLTDWRHDAFAQIRKVIREADPAVTEEFKWMGTPVWYHDGILACANALKGKVKITFDRGAFLRDPKRLFNASLEGNQRRAIDVFEKDKIDKPALKALVLAAIAFNCSSARKAKPKKPGRSKTAKT